MGFVTARFAVGRRVCLCLFVIAVIENNVHLLSHYHHRDFADEQDKNKQQCGDKC